MNIFELSINLIYSIIFYLFIIKYLEFKKNQSNNRIFICIFITIMFTAITLLNLYSIYEGFAAFIYVIITFIFAMIFLKGNIFEKLFACILEFGFLLLSSSFIILTISFAYNVNTLAIMEMEINKIRVLTVVYSMLLYIILLLIVIHIKRKINNNIKPLQWVLLTSIPLVSILLMISIVEITLERINRSAALIYMLFSIILIVALDFVILLIIASFSRNNKILIEYTLLNQSRIYEEKNTKDIQTMYNDTRKLRHDMKQHIEYILSEIVNIPEINKSQKKYLDNLIKYLQKINGYYVNIKPIINTGNDSVDNILNYKLSIARENNININSNITHTIQSIPDTDISVLLGNMLDNAIEACLQTKNIEKEINIKIFKSEPYINISIKNSIESSVLKNNPKLLSTKKDGEFHGMGMKSIKNIVEKNNGLINYFEGENFFCLEIMFLENPK